MEFDLNDFEKVPDWAEVHPVSKIYWIPLSMLDSNDYNPNVVAPPEMELLALSIREDGFTQPIVVWLKPEGRFEVVDGFHRFMIGRKMDLPRLPCVIINRNETQRNDRIASTIRHNRARGKHQVFEMSKIVIELKKRNWSDAKIGKNLGMEPDEVLRLSQVGGLAEAFRDKHFSEAWQ